MPCASLTIAFSNFSLALIMPNHLLNYHPFASATQLSHAKHLPNCFVNSTLKGDGTGLVHPVDTSLTACYTVIVDEYDIETEAREAVQKWIVDDR